MEHPSYSPDLTPNDFRMFPKMNSALKGRIFQDTEDKKKKKKWWRHWKLYRNRISKHVSSSGSIAGPNT
jgi:hypothetical protein